MVSSQNKHHIDHESTSFFIEKDRYIVRTIDKKDDFRLLTINDLKLDNRFDTICSPSAWPEKMLMHYGKSEINTHLVHVALTEDDQSQELVGLALCEENGLDGKCELGVIVKREFVDTRVAHELILNTTESEAAKRLAEQSQMSR